MEEYKANSHRARAEKTNPPAERRKVEPVVKGKVTTKKNKVRKFTDIFVSEDVENVKSYVVMDVLIPAAKKAISDVVTNGIDMILYGEAGHSKKRGSSSYVSYNRYSDRRDDDQRYGSRSRSMFDYDEFVFESRLEAEAVLKGMDEILDEYQVVSVLDLYDLMDMRNNNPQTKKYGWQSIRTADIVRVRDGYMLKLPKALPID